MRAPAAELPAGPVRAGDSADPATDASAHASFSGGIPGRRTVTITGRGAERSRPPATGTARQSTAARTRSAGVRPHERPGFRPDRVAMWAVLLGLVLVLIAATSSHAAMLSHALAH